MLKNAKFKELPGASPPGPPPGFCPGPQTPSCKVSPTHSKLRSAISDLSENVMFVGDFNSKLEAFGCASKNTSGPMLKTIQNKLNLIYVNNDEHTHMDRRTGSTDILDMAFIFQNLAIHDIQFQIGVDLGSITYPLKSQFIQHHLGTPSLTTPSINLTRLT